jgi:RNA polymerase sigma-70 factor (ECF subfamily)
LDPTTPLTRAARGDRSACDALFARHAEKLRLYVEFRLGRALARRVEVEDVVQETFLRAWRDLATTTLSGDGAFFGWLSTIARHVIADVARAARAQKRQGEAVTLERSSWSRAGALDPAESSAGPATRAARDELRTNLRTAFLALSPAHRRVIALRQFEQRSARESAPRLGCSELAVHALFRRALDAWAREFERLGQGSG